jgi:hypothetical protein
LNCYYLNLELLLSNCYCLDIELLLSNFLSLSLAKLQNVDFFFLQQSKFSRSSPPHFLYTKSAIKKKKLKNTHLFYVYIAARSRIQQEHYLMILCSTIQKDARTLIFVQYMWLKLIKKKSRNKRQIERYNLWLDLL